MRKTKWTKEILEDAVAESFSMANVMRMLGLKQSGGSHSMLANKIRLHKIDISHFTGSAHLKNKKHNWNIECPLEDVLVSNSSYTNRGSLKKRLFRDGLLRNQCYECGCLPEWQTKKLALQLDHINGVSNDHRIENLRILCPNCHSQTPTFGNKKR